MFVFLSFKTYFIIFPLLRLYIPRGTLHSLFQINFCMIFLKKLPHRFHKSRPFHSLDVIVSINFLNDVYYCFNLCFSIFTLPTVFIFWSRSLINESHFIAAFGFSFVDCWENYYVRTREQCCYQDGCHSDDYLRSWQERYKVVQIWPGLICV